MAGRLNGRVAVITGGASGIGRACCVLFAEEGADIVIGDLQPAEETVRLVEAAGGRAIFVPTDITDEAQAQALVDRAVERFGRVDTAVLCAGISKVAEPESDLDPVAAKQVVNLALSGFRRIFDINVIGTMLVGRAVANQLIRQGDPGTIVNIASIAGRMPVSGGAGYCVSKAGVIMLTKVMALELASANIRVNAVGPGFTSTPMWDVAPDSPQAQWANGLTPMGRSGTPREQAEACLFLAGPESGFVTGQTLHPAGGVFVG